MGFLLPMFDAVTRFADHFSVYTHGFGAWGILLFVFVFVAVILIFLPITPFSLAAGAIYGWWGVPIAFSGAMIGSLLAFVVARGIGRPYIIHLCRNRPIVATIDRVLVKGGFRLVLLIRLSGALPFSLQNYVFGLSKVHWRSFVTASGLGLFPGAIIKVWIGKIGMDVLHGDMLAGRLQTISLVVAIAVTLIMIAYIGMLAYRELNQGGAVDGLPSSQDNA